MTRRTPPPHTTPEPPPVTEQDLMAAYIVIRPLGVPYALAMTCPLHTTLRTGERSCVKCPPKATSPIASGLRKYLERRGEMGAYSIKTMSDYGDGMGRVWLVERGEA